MQQLLNLWSSFDLRRKIVLLGASIGVFVAVLGLARIATAPNMSLLYSGLENGQAGEVVRVLEQRNAMYEVRGDSIYVDGSTRDELRMTLASEGLPANSTRGYELLDSLSGFGTTSQMFDAAYWRAKEGELARTIIGNRNITSARVHISNTGSNPFMRVTKPTASITVTTNGGALSSAQARALRYLVASAVAGLAPEGVAVIDGSNGLVGMADETPASPNGADREAALRDSVRRLLEARVGQGNAIVEISIQTVTETESIRERVFDPTGRVIISSDTEERSTSSRGANGGAVTVASNLPDGEVAEGSETSNEDSETRERVNYEVSETQRDVVREPGAIRRITAAVLVNGVSLTSSEGAIENSPRAESELSILQELVESAIGYDPNRGDVVTLRSMAFEPITPLGTAATTSLMSQILKNPIALIQMAVLGGVALILGLFVLRPLLARKPLSTDQRLAAPVAIKPPEPQVTSPSALTGEVDPAGPSLESAAPLPALANPAASGDPVDRLRTLISDRQEETVEILRGWLEDKEGAV